MNKQPNAKATFRAMRDSVLDASPEELEEAVQGAGLDMKAMVATGREAVKGALKEATNEQMDEKVTLLHKCLSSFLILLRRRDGLDEEELAAKARVEAEEIRRIEYDSHYMPQPRTLFNLERVFKLPMGSLGKLAGAIHAQDDGLQENASRFAANAKDIGKLTSEERKLLNAFVKYLAQEE